MHRILCATLIAGLASGLIGAAPPKVMTITLAKLVEQSDLILVARVDEVSWRLTGNRIARATPIEIWKGDAKSAVEFLAMPTWTCDISTAVADERVVLFLRTDEKGSRTIAHSGRGRMPLHLLGRQELAETLGDVRFPEGVVRRIGEDVPVATRSESVASAPRGIELSVLKRLVAEEIEAAKRAAAEAAAAAAEKTPAEIR